MCRDISIQYITFNIHSDSENNTGKKIVILVNELFSIVYKQFQGLKVFFF